VREGKAGPSLRLLRCAPVGMTKSRRDWNDGTVKRTVIPSGAWRFACESLGVVEGPASWSFMDRHSYHVYMVGSRSGVLYIGMTNNLERRILKHENDLIDGFSKQ
jgi:hypothetical protein